MALHVAVAVLYTGLLVAFAAIGFFLRELGRELARAIERAGEAHAERTRVSLLDAADRLSSGARRLALALPRNAGFDRGSLEAVPIPNAASSITGAAIIAPNSSGTVVVAPTRSQFFEGSLIRIAAASAELPALEQRVSILGLFVNDVPCTDWSQWPQQVHRSTEAQVVGVASDVFRCSGGTAVPITLPTISSTNLVHALRIEVFNPNPYPVKVAADVFGEPLARPREGQPAPEPVP